MIYSKLFLFKVMFCFALKHFQSPLRCVCPLLLLLLLLQVVLGSIFFTYRGCGRTQRHLKCTLCLLRASPSTAGKLVMSAISFQSPESHKSRLKLRHQYYQLLVKADTQHLKGGVPRNVQGWEKTASRICHMNLVWLLWSDLPEPCCWCLVHRWWGCGLPNKED